MITLAHATAESTLAPSRFFDRWVDHASWNEWSPDTEWVKLDGPVARGTRGTLKPSGGPRVRFVISALDRDSEYTDSSRFLGATLVFQHLVTATPTGSSLEVTVTIDGPLARVWAAVLGAGFAESAPADLARLVAIAEKEAVASHNA